ATGAGHPAGRRQSGKLVITTPSTAVDNSAKGGLEPIDNRRKALGIDKVEVGLELEIPNFTLQSFEPTRHASSISNKSSLVNQINRQIYSTPAFRRATQTPLRPFHSPSKPASALATRPPSVTPLTARPNPRQHWPPDPPLSPPHSPSTTRPSIGHQTRQPPPPPPSPPGPPHFIPI